VLKTQICVTRPQCVNNNNNKKRHRYTLLKNYKNTSEKNWHHTLRARSTAVSAVEKGVAFNVGHHLKTDQIIRPTVSRLLPQARRFAPTGCLQPAFPSSSHIATCWNSTFRGRYGKTTLLIFSFKAGLFLTYFPSSKRPVSHSNFCKRQRIYATWYEHHAIDGHPNVALFQLPTIRKNPHMADRRTCEAWGTLNFRVKGKFHPRTGHEGPKGEQKYNSTLSLTSVLYAGWRLMPRPGRFTPRKDPAQLCNST